MSLMLVTEVGIAQLPAVSFQQLKRNIDLFSSSYNALAEDQNGFIWFGSYAGGGLYRYDGYTMRSFLPEPGNLSTSVASTRILEVYVGEDGMVYVGTNFGFSIIDPITGVLESINNKYELEPHGDMGITRCFLDDTIHNVLWIGTNYGLARMNTQASRGWNFLPPMRQKLSR
ncbi:MAG: two-component regulator propeller domain-containing protein [Saprospiraceae bacterium]|nr:two-component regulator propeller domain-containing protein [Saprospiraceae bacterium]